MKRRDVLKFGALSFVLAPTFANANAKKHLVMVIDLSRCNGCKACTISCGVENGNVAHEHRCEVAQLERNNYTLNLPLLCNQCAKPSCVSVCPTRATFKKDDDGIVVIDSSICIGCNYCIQACPYKGVRFENSLTSTVDKCNFCLHRTSVGLLPACVETCIGEARVFGDINDKQSQVYKLLSKNDAYVLQPSSNTLPNVFYIGLTQYASQTKFNLANNTSWQR